MGSYEMGVLEMGSRGLDTPVMGKGKANRVEGKEQEVSQVSVGIPSREVELDSQRDHMQPRGRLGDLRVDTEVFLSLCGSARCRVGVEGKPAFARDQSD
jgi:hypothetical protein